MNNADSKAGEVLRGRSPSPSPLRLAAALAIAIFSAETALMVLLPAMPPVLATVLDAGMLTAVIAPLLYVLLYRPLTREMDARNRALAQLGQANTELERRVEERTAHLTTALGEREAAEKSVRESEARYRSMMEATDDLVCICSADYRIEYMNRAMIQKTGRDATGEPCHEALHGREDVCPWCASSIVQEGRSHRAETTSLKDGRTYHVSNVPLVHEDGSISKLAVIRDISDLKEAEEGLRRSLSLLSSTLESTGDGILVVDRSGRIVLHNRRFADCWRIPEEILERRDHERALSIALGQLRDPAAFLKMLKEVYEKPDDESYGELEFLDGRIFRCHSLPQRMAGTSVGRVWSYRDVTHEVKLEQQFRQSQKLEALGTLAGGIAHDFNNILTAILGYGELLQDDLPTGTSARSGLDQILAAGERAKELVRRILAFSRRSDARFENTHVGAVTDEALKLIRAALPATIELRYRHEATSDLVRADPTQLHQVLMNLCTNAAHAMRDSGGILEVALTDATIGAAEPQPNLQLDPGRYVRVTVSDTGCGMTRDVMEKIFEPFFTTKPVGEGTGLGLSAVHGIVKSHHGGVTVYSEPHRGTAFHVYLPKTDGVAAPQTVDEKPLPQGTERVLLVDDEEAVKNLGRAMLEGLGYRVRACSSGAEALAALREDPDGFDLLLTDQTMPKMTGSTLARSVLELRPDLPVILCTGLSQAFDPALTRCVREVLIKPVARRDLAETVCRVLDQKDRSGPAAAGQVRAA